MSHSMNTIEEALEDIKAGKIVIVVDDENRENEGDFVTAARNATPELINFMATHGRGLICTPLIEERCDELGLEMMVDSNNSHFDTPFTVSIDLIGKDAQPESLQVIGRKQYRHSSTLPPYLKT